MVQILPLLPVLAMLWVSGCRTAEEEAPPAVMRERHSHSHAPDSPKPADSEQAFRQETQRGLDTAYAGLASALDSLGRDSLAVRGEMREQYRRILRDAHTAKDNTGVFLEDLRVGAPSVTPEIWEEIRSRAELSLDTLRRLLNSADSARKRHPP